MKRTGSEIAEPVLFCCISKIPGRAEEFKQALALHRNKTFFDTIGMRSANCTEVSKGGQKV